MTSSLLTHRIKRLAPAIAERIAAGEVIERPSSVVKELVENSLDAGASEISVTLEDGGKSLIEVMDNGHGMPPDDLLLCIERHATSKLSSLEDLDRILTLGFRGEALPSVAAVSELSILSRARGADTASELVAGDVALRTQTPPVVKPVTFGHFHHAPHGTRIQARGLFSQVPARFKFLKSASSEVSHVRDWMERLALAYPHVGFQLLSGDRKILTLRPQTELERVREVLSDGDDYPVVVAQNGTPGDHSTPLNRGLKIRLYWIQGLSCAQAKRLVQVVNFRPLRDRFLQQAMLSPFRQILLPGQFPALALFIEVNPAALDVNIHPTKSEVRFLDQSQIFQAMQGLVKEMVSQNGAPARVPLSSPLPLGEPDHRTPPTWSVSDYRSPSSLHATEQSTLARDVKPAPWIAEPLPHFPQSPVPMGLLGPPQAILFQTYLLYEDGNELVLIDQHAAHERIRYEKLKKRLLASEVNQTPHTAQTLLLPETTLIQEEDRPRIESRLSYLEALGFEVELFGENTLLFRSVPVEWGTHSLKTRLKNLIDKLLQLEPENESALLDESLFESLASEACHSAIRAGDRITGMEAQSLVQDLFRCTHPWNCPHGRPTVVRMPERKLEEWFQRKL